MKNKILISIMTVMLVAIISLANVPTTSAYVPVGPPIDPPLDPGEVFVGPGGINTAWSFFYGYSPNYGSYIRNVQWLSPTFGWERYMGMLSVPYIMINGVTYMFPGIVGIAFANPAADHYTITYTYPAFADARGDIHNVIIIFDIWHTPPAPISPLPGTDARIRISATDTIIQMPGGNNGWMFAIPIRADFDIHDIASAGADDIYIWLPAGGGGWAGPQPNELTYGPVGGRAVDPIYGMEILVNDPTIIGAPWGGIVPFTIAGATPDSYDLVLYNPPPAAWEYLGPGAWYVNGQPIAATDNIVWDLTSVTINPPPPGGGTTINVDIWLN